MAWVRLDDGFTANSKIAQLSDSDFRVWLRVLCHCARAQDPTVDHVTIQEVAGLTRRRVERYAELRLLDPADSGHIVHDWQHYQPRDTTGADRQARWRARQNGRATVTETVT